MPDLEARLAQLEHRVGELEDLNAIRRLHWAYGYYIDFNRAEDVVQLFAGTARSCSCPASTAGTRACAGSTAPGSRTTSRRA